MRVQPPKILYARNEQYLLDRSIPEPNTGCWLWLGALTPDGYASIRLMPFVRAHALAAFLAHGPCPEGMEVDHKCRVRCCVNPDHVQYLTHVDNTKKAINPKREQTHCMRGHPLSGENLKIYGGGKRRCKICERTRSLGRSKTHWKRNRT